MNWKRFVAGAAAVLTLVGGAMAFFPQTAPFAPLVSAAGRELEKTAAGGSTEPASSPAPSTPGAAFDPHAPCSGSQVNSTPLFCACVDGHWRDYFNRDAGCGP